MICAHRKNLRTTTPDKKINIAIIDKLDLRKYFVEIDGLRYSRDSVLINYEKNAYIQQYKDLKLFYREYIVEPILNPFYIIPRHENKIPY